MDICLKYMFISYHFRGLKNDTIVFSFPSVIIIFTGSRSKCTNTSTSKDKIEPHEVLCHNIRGPVRSRIAGALINRSLVSCVYGVILSVLLM